jgi:hypothetical protein
MKRRNLIIISVIIFAAAIYYYCIQTVATMTDYKLPDAQIATSADIHSEKLKGYRINGVAFIPYLTYVGHTTQKLEIVAYTDNPKPPEILIRKVEVAGMAAEDEAEFHFKPHKSQPYQSANYIAFSSLDNELLASSEKDEKIKVALTIESGGELHKLNYELEKEIRNYSRMSKY